MSKISKFLTVSGALVLSATSLEAAEWTGFHAGAGVGAGAVVHELDLSIPPLAGTGLSFNGIGGEGAFLTVQLGADMQISPRFVVGAFVDYDFSNIDTELTLSVPGVGLSGKAELAVESQLSLGVRAGWLPTESAETLWYAMAGYTRVTFDDASVSISGPVTFAGSAPLPDFSGFFVGGGVETMLMANISLKAEYRYTQLSSETLFAVPGVFDFSAEPSLHTARIGVSYRFGGRKEIVDDETYK